MRNEHESAPESTERTRREFLKLGTAAGAALSGGAGLACRSSRAATGDDRPGGSVPITVAGYAFDRVAALADGRVPIEGCDVRFESARIGDMNTHVFQGSGTRDLTEIGLSPFLLAYANEGFREYSLIPVFPLRAFRHKSIFIRRDRGILRPEDLKGRCIATPSYSSTSLTYIRGILEHEYGVKPTDVRWVQAVDDSSSGIAGSVSEQEQRLPDGIEVVAGTAGKDESQLLVDGEVDAIFHAAEPRAFVQGNPLVGRLFSDSRAVERVYFAETGIFPIMHAIAVKNSTAEHHAWLPEAAFRAYSRAKDVYYGEFRKAGWAMNSLPWVTQEAEATRELMGDNWWPYGVRDNRKALQALLDYSFEQGLASRRVELAELFHPTTHDLVESM